MKMLAKLRAQASQLKREGHALWLAYGDRRTPWPARFLIVCVIAYALSPIDLIPDPIPIIGHLDDLILLALAIALAIRMVPDSVMADCRERACQTNLNGPHHWKWGRCCICRGCVAFDRPLDVAIDLWMRVLLAAAMEVGALWFASEEVANNDDISDVDGVDLGYRWHFARWLLTVVIVKSLQK